jgi:gas vesicle protein
MATEPDRIRTEIEATRAGLADNVDQLADRTVPSRIAQRSWGRFSGRVQNVRERVMGMPSGAGESIRRTTGEAAETVQEAAGSTADAVRQAPRMAAEQTRGNPLAAGLIAFGAGLLAATLLPESNVERRATERLSEGAEGLKDQLRQPLSESASRLGSDLSDSVRESAQEVTRTAKEAARTTADEARGATSRVREESGMTSMGEGSR